MRILALDLGTTTGWACSNPGLQTTYGKWELAPKKHEDSGMRLVKFQSSLDQFKTLDLIVYEEVSFRQHGSAAIIYGQLLGALMLWAKARGIRYTGVPVGTIKKHATGGGKANKLTMIKAANDKFDFVVEPLKDSDHDIADALHLLDYAMQEYKE